MGIGVEFGRSDCIEIITDSKGGEGFRGTDEKGRRVNVRPNSSDGRPTLEIQDGKNRTKIRYCDGHNDGCSR